MSRHLCAILAIVVLGLGATVTSAIAPTGPARFWNDKLEALQPSHPLAYFLLAEEIADAASDAESKELARTLYSLSAMLATEQLGRSACIALAALAEDEQSKRRLTALAALLATGPGGQGDAAAFREHSWLEPEDAELLAFGDAISFYRRGVSSRAAARIERGGALALLRAVEDALPSGTVHNMVESSPAARTRPQLSTAQTVQMLQVEAALLSGRDRSWSSDLALTRSYPLIEVDLTRLDDALGIDARRARYRNGRWVE